MALSAHRLVAGALVILAAVALARSDAEQRSPRRYDVADAMGSGQLQGQAPAPPCQVSPPFVSSPPPPPCPAGHQDQRREAPMPRYLGVQRTAPAPPSPRSARQVNWAQLPPPPPSS
ncbi:unnamed protein product [Miscanthus lutarioriparius]|uniref:Uncharacterized protein n=1 Tax=Miscanthus lutarioriparius TaxID=422564 RepID=A0A811MJ66_9POAL|nr:unnamed protein product [Miscanthus lutarioriparius]